MSAGATSAGARWREIRNRPGSVGWRTLIWPNASTMPSWARMRLASESSSRMAARLSAMGVLLGLLSLLRRGFFLHKPDRFEAPKNGLRKRKVRTEDAHGEVEWLACGACVGGVSRIAGGCRGGRRLSRQHGEDSGSVRGGRADRRGGAHPRRP